MQKRIFISIGLPEKVKNKLVEYQEELAHSFTNFNDFCPIKWSKKYNLHITLFFIGYIEIEELVPMFNTIEKIAENHGSFVVDLKSISYGPKEDSPKMIWARGEKSIELENLQADLEKELFNVRKPENGFTPHITLGKVIQWQFNRIEPEERPDIFKDISLSFPVNSIEIMESNLGRGGADYAILKSIPLK
ncbi:MAG TPA: RNA 2',3'-cyclic phosphodiesterase [Candidatus Pacearchaeota archaeon]|nr:RNA 2',3'-cyclic phosphodiesterase [Candidatus Pacearchaeota archaeon]HPR80182.1 RNA 2',3'-cyclic phosphodiesterase [Candidatus Pacearchaeota archaeon]